MTYFSADFRSGDRRNLPKRGPRFPGHCRPGAALTSSPGSAARPGRSGPGPPPLGCYSSLGAQGGAAGRRRRWGGAAGARRRHPRGAGRRGGRTPPWEEADQVWLRRRVPAGRRLAPPPTNTTTQPRPGSSAPSSPCEPQLSLPLPLPARRRPRHPRRPRWRSASSRSFCAPQPTPRSWPLLGAPRPLRAGRPSRLPGR